MLEAYAVGITISLKNLVSPQLVLLSDEFKKLDLLAAQLTKSLGKIEVDSSALRSLTRATDATNRAFERANLNASTFRNHLAAINASGAAAVAMGGGGRGSGGGGHGGGSHGGSLHVGPGGVGLGAAGFAMGDWFWPAAAGGAALYGGHALYESAKDLNTEQARFRLFGMSEGQNQDAFAFAKKNPVYGTTQIERLAALREAQGVFRESGMEGAAALAGAKIAMPVLAKLDMLASTMDDESAAKMHTANLAMLRYVEQSGGLKSAGVFQGEADWGYKLNVSSGGAVNWEQLRQIKTRAGAAGFNLSHDALAELEPVITALKGSSAGFGLRTAYNRLTGAIRVPNQVAHDFVDAGIWDSSAIDWNKSGAIKRFKGDPLSKDKLDLLSSNFPMFYETYAKPYYNRMGFDAAEIARHNTMFFGSTGGLNASIVDRNWDVMLRSLKSVNQAAGINDASKKLPETLSGQEKEFQAAWTDFKTQFGTKMLPFYNAILKTGSAILRWLPTDAGTDKIAHAAIGAMPGGGFFNNAMDIINGFRNLPSPLEGKWDGKDHTVIHTTVNIDGKKVADAVSKHQGIALSRPQTGIYNFDPGQMLIPAGGL